MTPALSVVIASIDGQAALMRCVESLITQAGAEPIEIVVAACCSAEAAASLSARFPGVRLLHFSERKSIPELRAIGLLEASGDIVAMTEDHCVADWEWARFLLRAHAESPAGAIGGPVENGATIRAIDWAVYFCEYGRYMSPVPRGSTNDLPGPNVSYKRSALEEFRDLLSPPTWEPFWHWRLMSRGIDLQNEPKAVIVHRKNFTFAGFWSERYHYARSFAGMRVEGAPLWKRAMFAAGTPLLPPVLIIRMLRQILPKRRHVGHLLRSLPLIGIFTLSWAAGELVGYTSGPGTALARID
jgi:glycosyltransferase involved in cell wall biosynthesis